MIGLAVKELAADMPRIGTLTLTPDLGTRGRSIDELDARRPPSGRPWPW